MRGIIKRKHQVCNLYRILFHFAIKFWLQTKFNQVIYVSFTGEYLSDKNLAEGWYRFTYEGKPAVASTDCIKVKKTTKKQQNNV